MKLGRPTKYRPEFVDEVDRYLEESIDEVVDGKLKVSIPTIEGFAMRLDIGKRALYDYEKDYPEFSHALDKIRMEQKKRLLNMGLSGDYNSTIAKLILSANHGMTDRVDTTSQGESIAITGINYVIPKDGDNTEANNQTT